jgi:hypothetical protein
MRVDFSFCKIIITPYKTRETASYAKYYTPKNRELPEIRFANLLRPNHAIVEGDGAFGDADVGNGGRCLPHAHPKLSNNPSVVESFREVFLHHCLNLYPDH